MKRIVLLLLLLSAASLSAQSWRAVQSQTEAFFTCSHQQPLSIYTNTLAGLKCDSVTGAAGDTVYYPYRTMQIGDPNVYCNTDAAYPIWCGKAIHIDASGQHEFFTLSGDTLRLNTATLPGDTQLIYRWPTGKQLLGIHTSTSQQTFASITDSVKTYTLQVVDAFLVPQASWWNGKKIMVSKNNGLVTMMNVRDFPADSMMLFRVKARRLTYGDVYTWQPGDEIHELEYRHSYANAGWDNWLVNRYVLSRTMINADSVVFTIRNVRNHTSNWPPTNTITIDTTQLAVGQLSSYIQAAMPAQTIFVNTEVFTYDLTLEPHDCGKLRMVEHRRNSVFADTCIHYESFEPFIHDNVYVEDVAGYYFTEQPHFLNNYSAGGNDFVYFYGSTFTCGMPMYVGVDETVAPSALQVYPNPADDALTVEGALPGSTFEIFNAQGQLVLTASLQEKTISISSLSPGMYFAKISGATSGCFRFVKR